MTPDAILLICPALLESRGPEHTPPRVSLTDWGWTDNIWTENGRMQVKQIATPLWWQGAPVWPAIDAASRDVSKLLGLKGHIFSHEFTREQVLELAGNWAHILGATLINLEPDHA